MLFGSERPANAVERGAGEPIAAAFYGGTLGMLGILVIVMWRDAARGHRLLASDLGSDEARRIGRRLLVEPAVHAVATLVALVLPLLALVFFLLLDDFLLWPRESGRRDPRART